MNTLIRKYLTHIQPLVSEGTRLHHLSALNQFMGWLGSRRVARTDEWATSLVEKYAKTTINTRQTIVKKFLNWAHEHDKLTGVEYRHVKLIAPQSDRPIITEEEYQLLLDAADEDWKLILTIGWHTGLRFGDVLTLKSENVDVPESMIRRTPIKTRRFNTKVRIPLQQHVLDQIKERMGEYYIFPDLAMQYLYRTGTPKKQFTALRETAGVDKTFHSFRHGFVTRMLEKGISPAHVSIMTGHSIKEVMRYQRVSDDALTKMVTQ